MKSLEIILILLRHLRDIRKFIEIYYNIGHKYNVSFIVRSYGNVMMLFGGNLKIRE